MIARDPAAAARARHDLAIVGGGFFGVALALEAARRGLRPVLVERGDFGGETSWNSQRIAHGGLRYLQSLDLARHRESVGERAWLLGSFPDLVEPLPCLMPLTGVGLRRPWAFRLAFAADAALGAGLAGGAGPGRRPPRGRVLSPAQTRELYPAAGRRGLSGGALWHDGRIRRPQRLLIEMLHWACAAGATALNYVEATGLRLKRGRVAALAARDLESGVELELEAPVAVNCAGPWAAPVAARLDREAPELAAHALSFNLLLDRPPLSRAALALPVPGAAGRRSLFLLPWEDGVLAGTAEVPCAGERPPHGVGEAEVAVFLDELARAAPALGAGPEHVLRVLWGRVPARAPGSAEPATRDAVLDHRRRGGPEGLWSVRGVKLTTCRAVAERTLARIARSRRERLTPAAGPARPAAAAVPAAEEIGALLAREPAGVAARLREITATEAVRRPGDLLLRRTDWGLDPRRAARIAGPLARAVGWDEGETLRALDLPAGAAEARR